METPGLGVAGEPVDVSALRADIAKIRRTRALLGIGAVALVVGGRLGKDALGLSLGTAVLATIVVAPVALVFVLRMEKRQREIKSALAHDPRFVAALAIWRNRSDGRAAAARFCAATALLVARGVAAEDAGPTLKILTG